MNIEQECFQIAGSTFDQVFTFVGKYPSERGGMIGRDPDGVIRHFVADVNGRCSGAAYDPDIKCLNKIIKEEWKPNNIEFCGFIHSHPKNVRRPSGHDNWYAGEILNCFNKLEKMWMPIIQTIPDTGWFELIPFAAIPNQANRKACAIIACDLEIVGYSYAWDEMREKFNRQDHCSVKSVADQSGNIIIGGNPIINGKEISFGCQAAYGQYQKMKNDTLASRVSGATLDIKKGWDHACALHRKYFKRLKSTYDLNLLDKTRLIIIGTGGASSLVRDCARMGIGEFVLIDPDKISESNVGTQDAMPVDIGKFKTTVLGRDLVAINPKSAVSTYPVKIEEFEDKDFAEMVNNPLRWDLMNAVTSDDAKPIMPERVIIMALTDNFYAQARGHRLGLHFGLPTICAMEYVEGVGAEVTYTVPGITPACHRCITASRYRAYLQNGYTNSVTSDGAPVYAANFLNAILGHILLGVIHHGTGHPRWGSVLADLGNRNLLRIRMDHAYDQRFGVNAFSERIKGVTDPNAFYMLDTLFLPQTPDCGQSVTRPVCPDCNGTGDLASCIGQFDDTRNMRM